MTHICVGKLTIISSDNGLSPGRRQAIIWTNAGILLIGPLGTNFSEILIEIHTFSFKKMHFKLSSGKWRPFCLGLNVLSKKRRAPTAWHGSKTSLEAWYDATYNSPLFCIELTPTQKTIWGWGFLEQWCLGYKSTPMLIITIFHQHQPHIV